MLFRYDHLRFATFSFFHSGTFGGADRDVLGIGRMSEDLLEWSRQLFEDGAVFIANLLMVIYYVVPNLAIFQHTESGGLPGGYQCNRLRIPAVSVFAIGYAGILPGAGYIFICTADLNEKEPLSLWLFCTVCGGGDLGAGKDHR